MRVKIDTDLELCIQGVELTWFNFVGYAAIDEDGMITGIFEHVPSKDFLLSSHYREICGMVSPDVFHALKAAIARQCADAIVEALDDYNGAQNRRAMAFDRRRDRASA